MGAPPPNPLKERGEGKRWGALTYAPQTPLGKKKNKKKKILGFHTTRRNNVIME